MNSNIKKKWVRALRSGKYVQGFGQLKEREFYCCLGVLCHVAKIELTEDGAATVVDGIGDGYQAIHKIGVDGTTCSALYWMNDDDKKSFSEIADYIEKNLLPSASS